MNIKNNLDLEALQQKIKPILLKPCWKVDLSYGKELRLEIGGKVPYTHPAFQGEYKGEWQFGSRGTDWKLVKDYRTIVTSALEEEEILSKTKILEGTKITDFEIGYPGLVLTIEFNHEYQLYQLIVTPDLTDTEYQDVACWELFAPGHRLFEVYPNYTWFDRPSDVPIDELIDIY